MNKKNFALLAVLIGLAGALPAQGASRTWSSSIYWFNPSGVAGTAQVNFIQPDGTIFSSDPLAVAAWASGTIPLDTAPAGFSGSAVISSDLPLVTVYRQEGARPTVTSPEFTTAGDSGLVGTGSLFVPEVILAARRTTLVTVQNLEADDIVLDLRFLPAGAAEGISQQAAAAVAPGASAQIDPAGIAALGGVFEGSLVITARLGTGAAARMAATVQVLPRSGNKVYAYEAAPGAEVVNLPLAQCTTTARTLFDVQNAGETDAEVTIDYYYYSRGGGLTTVHQASLVAGTAAPGSTLSLNTCAAAEVKGRKNAVAVVTARNASGAAVPLVATGALVRSDVGTTASFTGAAEPRPDADGKYRQTIPMAYWTGTNRGYRTTVHLMNTAPAVGTDTAPAVVSLTWHRADGAAVSQNLRVRTRTATNAMKAGALTASGTFKGAVVLESDVPFAALAVVENVRTGYSGGYTSQPLP